MNLPARTIDGNCPAVQPRADAPNRRPLSCPWPGRTLIGRTAPMSLWRTPQAPANESPVARPGLDAPGPRSWLYVHLGPSKSGPNLNLEGLRMQQRPCKSRISLFGARAPARTMKRTGRERERESEWPGQRALRWQDKRATTRRTRPPAARHICPLVPICLNCLYICICAVIEIV